MIHALVTFAAEKIDANSIGLVNPVTDANKALSGVLTTVYFWAGIVAVLVIVIAGYFYTTSGGNGTQTKRAQEALIGASVGLIVVLAAFTITQFVIGGI